MSDASDSLINYTGGNPFRESQAREYPETKALEEFFPTNIYYSLFNEQNEILIGTRGSGKTILLRMLSYSCLRQGSTIPRIHDIKEQRQYIGFYMPLHLEFISRVSINPKSTKQYFFFSLNCAAAESLIYELRALLEDCIADPYRRIEAEASIIDSLISAWELKCQRQPTTLENLAWEISLFYGKTPQWNDKEEHEVPLLARSLLIPIRNVLNRITSILGLNPKQTYWIICIDEAEFLPEEFIKAINTVLRSEKRPLIVKMATLPFKHSTLETLDPNTKIEPNGNDFNYRKIDYDPDSEDFIKLTDHITKVRLKRCGVETLSLEDFLGAVGKDEGFDYYKEEFGADAAEPDAILAKIRHALPPKRVPRFDEMRENQSVMAQQYLKKFSPVLYVREMRNANKEGNRTASWFVGARMTRRVSDGNPRRFLQLMDDYMEGAMQQKLTLKNQHRIIEKFADESNAAISNLPKHGIAAKIIIEKVGEMLSRRTHSDHLVEAGCDFRLSSDLLLDPDINGAIEVAVAYSHIVPLDNGDTSLAVSSETRLRLSYLHAVKYWLPMRKGDPTPVLKPSDVPLKTTPRKMSIEEEKAQRIASMQLQLELPSDDDEE